jgi:RNA polymerase sigma factor (sigma-70 family)
MPGPVQLSSSDFSLLCSVIERVARAGHLGTADAEDVSQWVHLTLLERHYAPLARFAGRSSFRTFLMVVVRRLLLDWRNATHGKWRPSAWATREGGVAINLDRLITRDGHSVAEAVAILQDRPGSPPVPVLREIADGVPFRRRRQMVTLNEDCDTGTAFHDPVEVECDRAKKRDQIRVLSRAYRRLTPRDRTLLSMRFGRDLKVVAIARALGLPSKPLYQQIEQILAALRKTLGGQSDRPQTNTRRHRARSVAAVRGPRSIRAPLTSTAASDAPGNLQVVSV